MFESREPAGLIDAMGEASRAESVAIAQRMAAMGELFAIRLVELADTRMFMTDPMAATAAEVSAACNISRGRATGLIDQAYALRERLPEVAAAFARGDIDHRMVSVVIARTANVEPEVIGALDQKLAQQLHKWMRWSYPKLRDRLDMWVADFDPAGVRVPPKAKDNRFVAISERGPGMAGIYGHLSATDAAALDQRLDAIAATVCAEDPRTPDQRRADGCGALGRGETSLACECGTDNCALAGEHRPSSSAQIVFHVLGEQGTLDGTSDRPGYLAGFGVLPAESVRQVAATAKVRPVRLPSAVAETGYRPSARLTDFLQWRDLTCRFPGCDAPVADCDVDHTAPWPFGVTHASGLKHYCRTHHLIKTFVTGPSGWTDEQRCDGTIVFTAPTGHVYTTEPHGAALFPGLAVPTAALAEGPLGPVSGDKTAMMPRRRQTREQDRRDRTRRERRERLKVNAEQERQRRAWLAATYEPPPF